MTFSPTAWRRTLKRTVRYTILSAMVFGSIALTWVRPWAWQSLRQEGTNRLLHRAWLGPWQPNHSEYAQPEDVVRSLVLADVTLPQVNLRDWRLAGVQIANANLSWASGERLTMWHARLDKVRLVAAQLNRARLSHVEISESSLRSAKARGAYFVNSRLRQVDMRDADLRGAALQQTIIEAPVDLRGADLRGATFSDADLRLARLEGARLEGARCVGTVLFPSGFDAAAHGVIDSRDNDIMRRASAKRHAAAFGARQDPRTVSTSSPQIAPEAELDGTRLPGADLAYARLRGASLRDAVLCYAMLRSADLRSADLRGANLSGANLAGADMTGARLDGATLAGCLRDTRTRWPSGFVKPSSIQPHDDGFDSPDAFPASLRIASWAASDAPARP